MARLSKDAPGGISGLIGPIITASWKGIPYVRARAHLSKKPPTQAQLSQRARFRLAVNYLKSASRFLASSFPELAVRMSGFNYAIRYNMKNAVTGVYPDLKIDPALVLISRGDLPNVLEPAVRAVEDGFLEFSWKDNSGLAVRARAEDRALFIALMPDGLDAIYTTAETEKIPRSAGIGRLDARLGAGTVLETYISFLAADGDVATSIYTGQVTLL